MSGEITARVDRPYVPADDRSILFMEATIDPGRQADPATRQVVLCVDASSSMSGEKIRNARQGANMAIGLLDDDDHLGVVSFDTSSDVVLQADRWGALDADDVRNRIDGIVTRGGTDIYSALERSRDMLTGLPSGEGIAKQILLLSDGADNERDAPDFEPLADAIGDAGISVIAAGIGEYDKATIKTIGENSQGRWTHVTEPSEIMNFFGDGIGRAESTIVSNPSLEIDPVEGAELIEAYRRLPQIQRAKIRRQNGTYSVDLPDLIDEEEQQVMIKLEIPKGSPGEAEIATLDLKAGSRSDSTTVSVEYTEADDQRIEDARDIEIWAQYQDSVVRDDLASAEDEDDVALAEQKSKVMEQVAGDAEITDQASRIVDQMKEADDEDEFKEIANESSVVKD